MSTVHVIVTLTTPIMLLYLCIFFIVFECVCNFFAELTR